MTEQAAKARRFLELHHTDAPLLLPNPWDVGTARLFAALGFQALATTSSGHASTLGRLDGKVTREEALEHAAAIVAATPLPVSADLENCFAHEPEGVAATARLAAAAGLAGFSVEDYTGDDADPIYDPVAAAARVEAAVAVAHEGPSRLVVTARAENFIHDRPDLDDTIARLQAFQEAGADILYAPGVRDAKDIGRLVAAVDLPVNVLALPGVPNVTELGELGVKRVSIGSGFNLVGIAAAAAAAREFLHDGTYGFWEQAASGIADRNSAFG